MLNAAAAVTLVKTANGVPVISDPDRVFNYLEAAYPQYAKPAPAVSANGSGYYYRYYASTNVYVGTLGGNVYYLIPTGSNQVELLGTLAEWLAIAAAAGY